MINNRDKNGHKLTDGDDVIVPEPNGSDIHFQSFVGTILEIDNGYATVEDSDSDCYTIECYRLVLHQDEADFVNANLDGFKKIAESLTKK
jgi:hypothetical protein